MTGLPGLRLRRFCITHIRVGEPSGRFFRTGHLSASAPRESQRNVNVKFYTLAEARATLPQLRTYMQAIQQARREIMRLQPQALPAIEKAAQNGGCKEAGELFVHGSRIEHGVKSITALGVVLKDLDRGLVDFLSMRQGREIYLCWHYGEEDIAYWHELNGGFAGRRPIDEHVQ